MTESLELTLLSRCAFTKLIAYSTTSSDVRTLNLLETTKIISMVEVIYL